MALVATVNNIRVYSNKECIATVRGIVIFADGSTCDPVAKAISNVTGTGYISIGVEDATQANHVTVGPTVVVADELELQGLGGLVSVEVHDGPGIEYTIAGSDSEVAAISADVVDGKLVIKSTNHNSQAGGNIFFSPDDAVVAGGKFTVTGARGMSIGNNITQNNRFVNGALVSQTITTGDGESSTTVIYGNQGNDMVVTVKVPSKTPITTDCVGDVIIGDIYGPLVATTSTSGTVDAGRVTTVTLTAVGDGDIFVRQVNGNATLATVGNGDVTIGGTMPLLIAVAQGSGDITVSGTATSAILTTQGPGDIDVAHVINKPTKHLLGSGDITVRQVG